MNDSPHDPATPTGHAPASIDLRCHRSLRGPYTGGSELLRTVVPRLAAFAPELLAPHATAVLAIAPDLAGWVPPARRTLTELAKGEERTRYYSVQRTRDLAFAVSEVVGAWLGSVPPSGVVVRFWELADADPTDRQLFATLCRRCTRDTATFAAAGAWPTGDDPMSDDAQAHVDADGTGVDPAWRAAYERLPEADRRRRHDARARSLAEGGVPGAHLGAIPYHLERGSEPVNAGVDAIIAALDSCFASGYYDAALDLTVRGRALVGPGERPAARERLSQRRIGALTYLERSDDAVDAIQELRRETLDATQQMRCSYMLSMLHTRHFDPARRDQDRALAWVNTAIAIADCHPDPRRRAFFGAFMRNARGLVELHRGNLTGSLALVDAAIERADAVLSDGDHLLHRTVLLHNRARVLVALGRFDEAVAVFDEVVARDPEYDEAFFDRAVAHRQRGDVDGAFADLSRAIELSIAFVEAHYNRADILSETGDTAGALRDLDIVLSVDPDHADALVNRAALHLAEGELEAAAADLDRGLTIDPDDAHLWSARGLLEAERGDSAAATAAYDRALALDDTLVEVWANRALLAFSSGRVAEAVADLDRAVGLADSPVLRMNRGIARQRLGNHAGALADLEVAWAAHDADVDEVDLLARIEASRHSLAGVRG